MADNGKLTTKQQRAIVALLTTATVEKAADKAGVGSRTLHRWLDEDQDFLAALRTAEGQAIDAATRKLIALQDDAILTVATIMADKGTAAGVRLRAARTVIEYLLKLRELRNMEERLTQLENIIYANNTNST